MSLRHLIATIEGRAEADGHPWSSSSEARRRSAEALLALSVGVAALGTFAGGLRAIGQVGDDPPAVVVAGSAAGTDTDLALAAAEGSRAELATVADLDLEVEVATSEPVSAAIDPTPETRLALPTPRPVGGAPAAVQRVVADGPDDEAPAGKVAPTTTTVPSPTTTVAPSSTTTAPPAPAPAAADAPAEPRSYTAAEVEAIILDVFGPGDGPAAVRVARCESGLNPRAISRGGANWGLFQINKVHRGRVESMGHRWEDLLDPRVNAEVAKAIFDGSGWRPWACQP